MPELHHIADEIDRIANECARATAQRPVLPYRLQLLGGLLLDAADLNAFDRELKTPLNRMGKTDSRWGAIYCEVWNYMIRTHVFDSPKNADAPGEIKGMAEPLHAIARYIRSRGKFITSKEAAKRQGVYETTITRRCNDGKYPGAIPPSDPSNTTGEWRIPEASVPIRKPDVAKSSPRKRPKLDVAAAWECQKCDGIIRSRTMPLRCLGCNHTTFARTTLKPSAV